MPQDHRIQSQRFELKYLVREATACMIRDFVAPHLQLDEFGAGRPQNAYPVHSLYLDSPSLALYWHTVNGTKNRHKLRVRFYDDRPDSPVFLEIKSRVDNAILKQRCGVRRDALGGLLAGHPPAPAALSAPGAESLPALHDFLRLSQELRARPVATVSYSREAWISPHDNSIRVTIDRHVRCAPEPLPRLVPAPDSLPPVFGNLAVIELKFTDRFPDWFGQMIRLFGLRQQSAAKYADGITRLGVERFTRSLAGCGAWLG